MFGKKNHKDTWSSPEQLGMEQQVRKCEGRCQRDTVHSRMRDGSGWWTCNRCGYFPGIDELETEPRRRWFR